MAAVLECGSNMHANQGKIRDCGNRKSPNDWVQEGAEKEEPGTEWNKKVWKEANAVSYLGAGGLAGVPEVVDGHLQELTPLWDQENCLGLSPLSRGRA